MTADSHQSKKFADATKSELKACKKENLQVSNLQPSKLQDTLCENTVTVRGQRVGEIPQIPQIYRFHRFQISQTLQISLSHSLYGRHNGTNGRMDEWMDGYQSGD